MVRGSPPRTFGNGLGDKTFVECVVREIYEEISYFLPSERFAHLIRYTGAHPLGGATVRFMLRTAFPLTNYRLPRDRCCRLS